jgi:hypothetical protein
MNEPRAPNMTPRITQAIVVPRQKKNQTFMHFFMPFAVMQKGARIGHEWPQGLMPCKSPRTIDAWIATIKVIFVASGSINVSSVIFFPDT